MPSNEENFNEDELEAPEWMNSNFFATVLNHCEKTSTVKVKTFKISPATVKGDHYASVMFRAKVDYHIGRDSKKKSLIIKIMPEVEGQKKEFLQESKIFETEIGMYTEVVPRFEKILREIGDDTILAAPCIFHSLSPKKIIIFEDLVPNGFTTVRSRLMTQEEEVCAYTKLAKWHAISYKILQEEPAYFDAYRYGILSLDHWSEQQFYRNGVQCFIEYISTEPSLAQYKKYFEPLKETLIKKCTESFNSYRTEPREDFLYVLCHGDFHMKNVMVKHNNTSGEFEDLMLLDFQMSYIGPIQNDIVYGFFMMLNEDSRLTRMDEMLYIYHQVFKNTLQKLGFEGKIPKLNDLKQQFFQDKYFELLVMCCFLPLWLKFRDGNADIDLLIQSSEYQKSLLENPMLLEHIQKLLPKYIHRGYLEDLLG